MLSHRSGVTKLTNVTLTPREGSLERSHRALVYASSGGNNASEHNDTELTMIYKSCSISDREHIPATRTSYSGFVGCWFGGREIIHSSTHNIYYIYI